MRFIKEGFIPLITFILYLISSIIPNISDFEKKYNISLFWTLVILALTAQVLQFYLEIGKLERKIEDKNKQISELTEKNSDLKDKLQTKNIVQQVTQHPLTISGTAEEIKSLLNVSPSPYSQLVPNNVDE